MTNPAPEATTKVKTFTKKHWKKIAVGSSIALAAGAAIYYRNSRVILSPELAEDLLDIVKDTVE